MFESNVTLQLCWVIQSLGEMVTSHSVWTGMGLFKTFSFGCAVFFDKFSKALGMILHGSS